MPTVTLTLEEFKALENGKRAAEERAVEAENATLRALLEDKDGRVYRLVELVRALMVPLRFAIANMPPEVTRNWPTSPLRLIAGLLPSMPDATVDDLSLIAELGLFADDADREDRDRALRKENHVEAKAIGG